MNKKRIIIIIIATACILSVCGGIFFYIKHLEYNNNSNISNSPINEMESINYDKVISQNVTLNQKQHKIDYKYYIEESHDEDLWYQYYYEDYNNEPIYILYLDIFYDEMKIKTVIINNFIEKNVEEIKSLIETLEATNIKILKGTDGADYLVFLIKESGCHYQKIIPFIINENGYLLYEFPFLMCGSIWVEDPNSNVYNQNNDQYLIEEDKIYFLTNPDVKPEGLDGFYVQENILTINENKVYILKSDFYKGNGAGQK